jgi:hypothetical protein
MQKQSALPGGSVELDKWNNSPELQEILQITWKLNGDLKNLQLSYLRIAVMLSRVRDEKLHTHMNHADIQSWAWEHLGMSAPSLYRYLHIHDWVKAHHPEWLEKKVKGRIPDLSDIDDLMWIEEELGQKDLDEKKAKALKGLQTKALGGTLKRSELRAFRRSGRKSMDGLRTFLSALRALIRRGAKLAGMPPAVITHLDAAVGILEEMVKQP